LQGDERGRGGCALDKIMMGGGEAGKGRGVEWEEATKGGLEGWGVGEGGEREV